MQPMRFNGATHVFGQPENYDPSVHGPITPLPVRIEEGADGKKSFTSMWLPTGEELLRIAQGSGIVISLLGDHPPLAIAVSELPARAYEVIETPNDSATTQPHPASA